MAINIPMVDIRPNLTRANISIRPFQNIPTNNIPTTNPANTTIGGIGNIATLAGGAINGVGNLIGNFKQAEGLKDTSALDSRLANRNATQIDFANNESLLNAWANDNPLQYGTLGDFRDSSATGKGILGGVISGASTGASFGPIGAAVGGLVGGLTGLFGGLSGKKKAQRKLEAYNNAVAEANKRVQDNFLNNVENLDEANDSRLESQFFAEGGELEGDSWRPSTTLRDYIKSKETFIPYVYDDRGGPSVKWDPNNPVSKNSVPTIGYGFTDKDLIKEYIQSGRQMTKEEGDKRLEMELDKRIKEVSSLPNFHKLNPAQQDALMALDYGAGIGNIKKYKPLMNALHSNDTKAIASALYGYSLGLSDPHLGGMKNEYKGLGDMFAKSFYVNPHNDKVIDEQKTPYRRFGDIDPRNIELEEAVSSRVGESKNKQARRIKKSTMTPEEHDIKGIYDFSDVPQMNYFPAFNPSAKQRLFAEGGYTEFNSGGTHEENPNNGIPIGTTEEGVEQKAEEGEVKIGDYIFSNRIKPDVAVLKTFGLPQNRNYSYADIAKRMKKKLDERPNDSISKNYFNQTIDKLKLAQETTKRLRDKAKENMVQQAAFSLGLNPEAQQEIPFGIPEGGEELFAEGGSKKGKVRKTYIILKGGYWGNDHIEIDLNNSKDIDRAYNEYLENNKYFPEGLSKLDFKDALTYMHYNGIKPEDREGKKGAIRTNAIHDYIDRQQQYYAKHGSPNKRAFYTKYLKEQGRDNYEGSTTYNPSTSNANQSSTPRPQVIPPSSTPVPNKVTPKKTTRNTRTAPKPAPTPQATPHNTEVTPNPASVSTTDKVKVKGSGLQESYLYQQGDEARPSKFQQEMEANSRTTTPEINMVTGKGLTPLMQSLSPVLQGIYNSTFGKDDNTPSSPSISEVPRGIESPSITPTISPSNNSNFSERINNFISRFDPTYLRYAPALLSGINAVTDAIGTTNKDDFTIPNSIEDEYRSTFTHRAPQLISGELDYKPFDTDYAINRLQSQGAATRRAIINNSGGNGAMANASLLAADYSLNNAIGDQMIKAQEYNDIKKRQVFEFNRQKEMFNSQQIAQANQLNFGIDSARIQGIEKAALLRGQERAQNEQNRNINRNAFFQVLGQIGREEQDRRFANSLFEYQIKGNKIKYRNGE